MKEKSQIIIGLSEDDEFVICLGSETHVRTERDDVIELITGQIIDWYPTDEELDAAAAEYEARE